MANWADDGLWSDEATQASPSTDAISHTPTNPWGDDNDRDETILDQDSPMTDNFSDLSVNECHLLCNLKTKTSMPPETRTNPSEQEEQVSQNVGFETDYQYLSKLERKLAKLYKLSGKEMKKSMLKQVSDRSSELFTAESDRQDTSIDKHIVINPVVLRLFPEQPITAEEKLELIQYEQLTGETTTHAGSAEMSTVVRETVTSGPEKDAG